MTTVGDIIALALKGAGVVGVGQTPLAEDTNDCFTLLNNMLAQWRTQRWLVYAEQATGITATGALSYSVGLGGDFNIARPNKIQAAFFRQTQNSPDNPVDYSLIAIESYEDYSRIGLKNLKSFPQYYFYKTDYPLAHVYFWPVPQPIYEVFIITRVELQQFNSISDTIILPPEYYDAIFWNLCVRLRPLYQMQPDPTVTAMAKNALGVIRSSNTQIPTMVMPPGLGTGINYNVYSDQFQH